MTTILLVIAALVAGYYVVFGIVRAVVIHRLTKRVEEASRASSRKLRKWVEDVGDGEHPSARWLRESNPEELFIRIISHAATDTKQRGLLLARLQSACKIIDLIDDEGSLAAFATTHISDDTERSEVMSAWFEKLKLYQVAVDQCFSDLKAQL
jgi:hypothetical protein